VSSRRRRASARPARSICKSPEPMFHISRLHFEKVTCHFFTLFDLFSTFSIADSTGWKLFTLQYPRPTPLLLLRRSYDFHHAPSTCSAALLDHRCVGRVKAGCVLLPAGGFATIGNRLVARTVGQLGGGSEGVLPAAQAEACICRVGEMPQLVRNRTALCIQLSHSTAAASGCSGRVEYFPQLT
jgi:hypothetical protein